MDAETGSRISAQVVDLLVIPVGVGRELAVLEPSMNQRAAWRHLITYVHEVCERLIVVQEFFIICFDVKYFL